MTLTTKYDIGKEVFYMDNNRVKSMVIQSVYVKKQTYYDNSMSEQTNQYSSDIYGKGIWINEKMLFPSKEELIASL